MDDSSPPLEIDYAERVVANCNIDIEITNPSLPPVENATYFSFSLPASNPCVPFKEAPNLINISDIDISAEPSPPEVISYSTNVLADISLWDGNFMATSLFGTNEFLNSDINNIMCSLQHMACFLRQQNVKDRNANNIRQLDPFSKSAWDFISAIFESGWDTLVTANKSSIRDNLTKKFGKTTKPTPNVNICHGVHISKVPPPIPPHPSKEILEKSKAHQRKISTEGKSPLSYAQIASNVTNALKIKEAFPALPNKKVLEMHNAAFRQHANKAKKVQFTTKGPSRKQAIIPVPNDLAENIMSDASMHIFQINTLLKNVKSSMCSEFICPCSGGITIITNNIPNPSDLSVIEKYFKSVEGINGNEIPSLRLPQSKSYLKITGLPYLRANGNKITSENVTDFMKHIDLFENISLATKPCIIKASPKSDMAIIWFDIWDTQNGSKAKLLINHSFNLGRHIATVRATNMNPGVSQCHNCWKWGYSTFSCRAHGSRCQKCSGPHKLEHHRELAWCCKANPKLNLPRLETAQGLPCPHSFKCINCKGKHMADDYKCPFWRNRFNRDWHSKKAQEAQETKANSIRLAVVTLLENFLWKCSMGYTLYPWISLLESTLETSYKPQT